MRPLLRGMIVLGVIGGIAAVTLSQRTSDRSAYAVIPPPLQGSRILYPASRSTTLTLPDGRREIVLSLLAISGPLKYGDYIWNEDGAPPGRLWIRVDPPRQMLSVFRGGHEIGTAVILYGTDGKPTPTGVFPVLQKAADHRSSLYDAPMPFMLRLTGDGVAIHASSVRSGSATHGCIGIPAAFARLLFDQVRLGDLVAIEAVRSGRTGDS